MGLAECLLMVLIALLVLAVPGLLTAIIYMLHASEVQEGHWHGHSRIERSQI